MGSFGINKHAHVDAAFFAFLLTLVSYGIKWIFGLEVPSLLLGLPTFIVIFTGIYSILFIVFLIIWSRK
jgi:hypothetical protein